MLRFAGVRECPPWYSIVGATVTVHQFFCILHWTAINRFWELLVIILLATITYSRLMSDSMHFPCGLDQSRNLNVAIMILCQECVSIIYRLLVESSRGVSCNINIEMSIQHLRRVVPVDFLSIFCFNSREEVWDSLKHGNFSPHGLVG